MEVQYILLLQSDCKMIASQFQILSHGAKIDREEPYLRKLIERLCKQVLEGDSVLSLLSLSVLVNLCYENRVAIDSLVNVVDIRNFIKHLISKEVRYNGSKLNFHLNSLCFRNSKMEKFKCADF
jgi:hypothetical protein